MKAEKIYDETFTARNFNTLPLTISGLEGDLYDYKLIIQWNFSSATANALRLNFNSDTTTNYRSYRMRGYSTTANASVSDSLGYIEVGSIKSTIEALSIINITGSSGDERYVDCFYSGENSVADQVAKISGYWKNTANEITSLTLDHTTSATSDAHIVLYSTPKKASQEKWELVESKKVTSEDLVTNPMSFTGLDGNSDIQYLLDIQFYTVTANTQYQFTLNSDTGSNYTIQGLENLGGTPRGINYGAQAYGPVSVPTAGSGYMHSRILINAESGVKRLVNTTFTETTVTANLKQTEEATWWSNTADNLTSIQVKGTVSSADTTGTAKLYRRKNPNTIGDTLPFELVEEVAVSGDFSAGHTFSGLSGDDVLMYKLEFLGKGNGSSNDMWMQINGDTGSNYTRQILRAAGSGVYANNVTSTALYVAENTHNVHSFNVLLYPKSGAQRPILSEDQEESTNLYKRAGWWTNTASEITSLKVYANATHTVTGTLKLSKISI